MVTGGAGFIGSHLVDRLLAAGKQVTVVDNFDSFYNPEMKEENVRAHHDYAGYRLVRADIRDLEVLRRELREDFDLIIHLAARAGVRPSIEQPLLYQEVNIRGTQNMLELARERRVERFIFCLFVQCLRGEPGCPGVKTTRFTADQPLCRDEGQRRAFGPCLPPPIRDLLYCPCGSSPCTARQRPDLAIHKFAACCWPGNRCRSTAGKPSGTIRILTMWSGDCSCHPVAGRRYELINLGNNRTVTLKELIHSLEEVFGVKARLRYLPEQPGDVPQTYADITKAAALLGYRPETPLRKGLEEFARWLEKHLAVQRVG